MNMLRLIAIALPVMLLMACGGGGGGGTAAVTPTTPTPMTMMPGTGDPMTPPGTGNPMTPPTNMPPTVTLPDYAITNIGIARMEVGGTAPTAANTMNETAIVTEIQRIATAADTFEFEGFTGTPSASITCSNANKSCSGTVPDVDTLTFSLAGIEDLSLVDDTGLVGFVSNTQAVMMDHGATIIQSRAAAGQNDGTHLTFQTYGGWLTNTVFGVERLVVTESGTNTTRYASFNFGNDSGSNPTGNTVVNWTGVVVGRNTGTGHVIHGDVTVQDLIGTANVLDSIIFNNFTNLNDGSAVTFGNAGVSILQFLRIPLTNGRFESASGDIIGNFYGADQEEVGGIFNSSSNNIIGAFGAKK